MRKVEEPDGICTSVSVLGPNGIKISQAAPAAANTASKKIPLKKVAAPERDFLRLVRLRLPIRWLNSLHFTRDALSEFQIPVTYDSIV